MSDDEEFTVSLMAADQNQLLDYRVSPSSYKTAARGGFTSSGDDTERVGPFTLEALSDEDIGEEELMLYVHLTGQSTTYGDGESNGMFSITIEDTTKPMVWAKSQEDIEAAVYGAKGEGTMSPGDSFELMTSRPVHDGRGRHSRLLRQFGRRCGDGVGQCQHGDRHGRGARNGPCHGHRHRKHGGGRHGGAADGVKHRPGRFPSR